MENKLERIAQYPNPSILQKVKDYTNVGRRFSEFRQDFYQRNMTKLREVDDKIRGFIDPIGGLSLREHLRKMRNYIKQGRPTSAMYHIVEISEAISNILKEVGPLKRERDEFVRQFYGQKDKLPSSTELDKITQHFSKAAADVNNSIIEDMADRWSDFMENMSRGRIAQILSRLDAVGERRRQEAMSHIAMEAQMIVREVTRMMKRLSDLRARGDIGGYIEVVESLQGPYNNFVNQYKKFYEENVKALQEDEKKNVSPETPQTPTKPPETTPAPQDQQAPQASQQVQQPEADIVVEDDRPSGVRTKLPPGQFPPAPSASDPLTEALRNLEQQQSTTPYEFYRKKPGESTTPYEFYRKKPGGRGPGGQFLPSEQESLMPSPPDPWATVQSPFLGAAAQQTLQLMKQAIIQGNTVEAASLMTKYSEYLHKNGFVQESQEVVRAAEKLINE